MEFVMNIILSSVRMATPLIFLALAELYSQRAGLVHIGLEGLASIGSLVGFLVSLITGSPMLGVLAGAAVGILVNMIFAYATVTLCAEQIVYGMAINIFAPALAAFIYRVYFGAGSELVQVGLMNTLSSSLGITSDNFLVRLLLDQTPMVYLAYGLVIFTVIYFNRTKSGLNYKAVGEYPKAAATLGINVIGVKYAACVICGALAGIGGAYLTTCYANTYVDGNVAGRGFIALAAVIFGRWSGAGVPVLRLLRRAADPAAGGQLRRALSVLPDDPLHRHRGGIGRHRHEEGRPQELRQALSQGGALRIIAAHAAVINRRHPHL